MMKFKIIASGHNFSEYSCSTLHRLKSGDKREGAFLHHENQFLFCEIPPPLPIFKANSSVATLFIRSYYYTIHPVLSMVKRMSVQTVHMVSP